MKFLFSYSFLGINRVDKDTDHHYDDKLNRENLVMITTRMIDDTGDNDKGNYTRNDDNVVSHYEFENVFWHYLMMKMSYVVLITAMTGLLVI